ncbi:MAG: (2Fe-2S)-binding protein [Elusimicrobia bacterium]|nr:(2Fe-2S)-binding protein [Elusimicrobiota bacterium]
MARITLNGRPIETADGALMIDVAKEAGIHIPHYCYHPALGNPGNCRMCLVEVQGAPKLQPACRLKAVDGMVVRTDSPAVQAAQAGALELHLVNHPLDCPVCDQSGECGLQDYYMTIGRYKSGVAEDKRHMAKRKPIGPHVMLDQERCLWCTRCTRFLANVVKTAELGIFGRGHGQVVDLAPGKVLDNPYSGNVVDICPVGALTDRDFRYKVRAWYLESVDSVCPGCSRGCGVQVHTSTKRPWHNEGRRVARLKPRYNPEVNGHWICDEGRYSYKTLDQDRLGKVLRLRPAPAGLSAVGTELSWDAAWKEIAGRAGELMADKGAGGLAVIASGALSNEDWRSFKKLFVDSWKVVQFLFAPEPDQVGPEDSLLRRKEKVPNLKGGEALGFGTEFRSMSWDALARSIEAGRIWGLYVVDRDVAGVWGPAAAGLLGRLDFVVFQGPFKGGTGDLAHYRLPSTAYVEEEGSFTNFEGRLQRYAKALAPLGAALPDWEIFEGILARHRAGKGEAL